MIDITFDICYGGKSYGSDLKKGLYRAAEDAFKDRIMEILSQVEGLDNDSVTVNVDLENGKVEFSDISSEEAREKIMKAFE